MNVKKLQIKSINDKNFYKKNEKYVSAVILKSVETSIEVFAYAKLKQRNLGKKVTLIEITEKYKCKKDNITRDKAIIQVLNSKNETRRVSVVLSDLEFVFSNLPIDRTVRVGSEVYVVNNKYNSLSKELPYEVYAIEKTNPSKKMHVVFLKDNNNKTYKTFMKNVAIKVQ